jgi:hypothetical protein
MKNELKRLLDPGDDGRAFTEAVLLRASGALYRRRQAVEARAGAWQWLERWARPWLVAALLVLAVAASLSTLAAPSGAPATATASASPEPEGAASLLTAPQPEDILAVTLGN